MTRVGPIVLLSFRNMDDVVIWYYEGVSSRWQNVAAGLES